MAEKDKELTEKVVPEAEELPKTIVRRVVKEKLSQLATDSEISVLRDSLQAFCESARIFIHYLSATANDICRESNRQIINAEDVFKALEEIEFAEFIGPLRACLEEFRQKNPGRKVASSGSSKAKDTSKNAKRKPPAQSEGRKKRREVESNRDEDDAD
ncbi:DNA polymerase epsilon subunit 3 [Sesamum indicum]|uniref:DNA polymerase epsilon subunit 3 n=1 Tax=Sesamum indicum TaxID=4182 RepID=A0A6I9U4Y3_SESIN|nr:DNA polymerase epsilon subunit 3 [Sesamum indicum]